MSVIRRFLSPVRSRFICRCLCQAMSPAACASMSWRRRCHCLIESRPRWRSFRLSCRCCAADSSSTAPLRRACLQSPATARLPLWCIRLRLSPRARRCSPHRPQSISRRCRIASPRAPWRPRAACTGCIYVLMSVSLLI